MNDDLQSYLGQALIILALCIGLSTCQYVETHNDAVRAQMKRDAK